MNAQMKAAIVFVSAFLAVIIALTIYTMTKSKSITEHSIAVRQEGTDVQKRTNELLEKLITVIEKQSQHKHP